MRALGIVSRAAARTRAGYVGVRCSSGGSEISTSSKALTCVFGSKVIPHPSKVHRGGEDAFFVCHETGSFGVADGVGGWIDLGVNSGIYSRTLLRHCRATVAVEKAESLAAGLNSAWARLRQDGAAGGTTVVLGRMEGRALSLLNIGDSGVLVVRLNRNREPRQREQPQVARVVFRSHEQAAFFNCPFQLSSDENGSDTLYEADTFQVGVRPGDMVIAGTDGVFDNLFDDEIAALATTFMQQHKPLQLVDKDGRTEVMDRRSALNQLASNIAEAARAAAVGTNYTPFTYAAAKEGIGENGRPLRGGKLDDITVVIAEVGEAEATHTAAPGLLSNTEDLQPKTVIAEKEEEVANGSQT
mmetsp:Transcript_68337/g.156934  ORF Transcript_68337/g.156934 Transcript_68337/m.156934 type:complete len:357 (+) Transcript_68337:73-1143(+)